jgi:hypothetical protein
MRLPCSALLLLVFCACDSAKEGTEGTAAPAASARPPVEIVVRAVELQKSMTTPPVEKGGEAEEWTAGEGKTYAIITAELAHNACKDGDTLDTALASLVLPGGATEKALGGGAKPEALCVQCAPKEKLDCATAGRLRPFTFLFEIPEATEVDKTQLRYKERDAALAGVKVTDKRGNADLDKEIAAKKAQLDEMRKKLENTSNMASGQIIESEMAQLKAEIAALEAKRK